MKDDARLEADVVGSSPMLASAPDGENGFARAVNAGQTDQPVLGLLSALGSGSAQQLTGWLDEDVVWVVEGLPVVAGRRAVLRFWTQLMPRYRRVKVSPTRLIADEDLRIAEQIHLLEHAEAGLILVENTAVYRVRDGRILEWTDHPDLRATPKSEIAVWRRLRRSA